MVHYTLSCHDNIPIIASHIKSNFYSYLILTSISLSYWAREVFSIDPNSIIPALFTKMSSLLNFSNVFLITFSLSSSFVTSAETKKNIVYTHILFLKDGYILN